MSRSAYTEGRHDRGGHRQVRLGDEVANDVDCDSVPRVRRGQQESAEVLRREISGHPGLTTAQSGGVDDNRRAARAGFAARIRSQIIECRDQRCDRAQPHAGHAIDAVAAMSERQGGGKKAHRGAGVADEEIGLWRGERAPAALDAKTRVRLIALDDHAEGVQRRGHVPRVVAVQRADELAWTVGQRRRDQRPVGDALRPGHGHRRVDRTGCSTRRKRWWIATIDRYGNDAASCDANQCSCQPARVPATSRPASERPASGFIRTKRERTMAPRRPRARCPPKPPLYSDEPVRAFQGGDRLELCRSRGHRRAWNHDRPGRVPRIHSSRRDRQRQRESGSVCIQRQANRHIIPEPRPTRRAHPLRHRCCRAGSAGNGEHCAESPSPWC